MSVDLSFQKKQKIDFQDVAMSANGMVLATFALQDTPMLPTMFQVNWPVHSGEEVKNRFSR